MKATWFFLIITISLQLNGYSQELSTTLDPYQFNKRRHADTTQIFSPNKKKFLVAKNHVIYWTYNLITTTVENEIIDLESQECDALLKHDTETLRKLWIKDFYSVNKPLNEVMGEHVLPYYISYQRTIEHLNHTGEIIFTSGTEMVKELSKGAVLSQPVERKFSHMWARRAGVWILVSKRHTEN